MGFWCELLLDDDALEFVLVAMSDAASVLNMLTGFETRVRNGDSKDNVAMQIDECNVCTDRVYNIFN